MTHVPVGGRCLRHKRMRKKADKHQAAICKSMRKAIDGMSDMLQLSRTLEIIRMANEEGNKLVWHTHQ